jgi:hypothetical protein
MESRGDSSSFLDQDLISMALIGMRNLGPKVKQPRVRVADIDEIINELRMKLRVKRIECISIDSYIVVGDINSNDISIYDLVGILMTYCD